VRNGHSGHSVDVHCLTSWALCPIHSRHIALIAPLAVSVTTSCPVAVLIVCLIAMVPPLSRSYSCCHSSVAIIHNADRPDELIPAPSQVLTESPQDVLQACPAYVLDRLGPRQAVIVLHTQPLMLCSHVLLVAHVIPLLFACSSSVLPFCHLARRAAGQVATGHSVCALAELSVLSEVVAIGGKPVPRCCRCLSMQPTANTLRLPVMHRFAAFLPDLLMVFLSPLPARPESPPP